VAIRSELFLNSTFQQLIRIGRESKVMDTGTKKMADLRLQNISEKASEAYDDNTEEDEKSYENCLHDEELK
jgi:hypothetical protein